jgi:CBS domain containing-hemolysin-like protein
LHGYLEKPENFLWTILVGNTLANLAVVGLSVYLLNEWLGNWPLALLGGFAALLFLVYAFCELLPKMLFRMYPNRLCLMLAEPFGFIHLVLSPLVALMTRLSRLLLRWTGGRRFTGSLFGSREEMRLFMQESAQGLTSEERMMINRVLDLQNITVRNVTIPLDQVPTVTAQTPIQEALRISQEKSMARLPVWREERGQKRIEGIVNLRAALFQADLEPGKTAKDYFKPALFLEEEMPLEEALKRMQRSGERLAIVLGRDRREVGIITLLDILKTIFGEVRL